jgi:hypothetical protein
MRRVTVIGAVVLAAAGIALAAAPFGRQGTIRDFTTADGTSVHLSKQCLPPIVSAFRHDAPTARGGWFGYAPVDGTFLSDQPYPSGPVTLGRDCRPAASNRLALALTLWFTAGALVLVRRRPHAEGAPSIAPA